MKELPLWASILLLAGVVIIGTYVLSHDVRHIDYGPYVPPDDLELQAKIDEMNSVSNGKGLVLTEEIPRDVVVRDGLVDVVKEGLTFRVPDGYEVVKMFGSDERTPVKLVVELEKGDKEIFVFVNYSSEFYGVIDQIELAVESEEKTAWQRPSSNNNEGPFDMSWSNVRVVKDTSRYLTVWFRGYAPEDKPIFESVINSLRYTQ